MQSKVFSDMFQIYFGIKFLSHWISIIYKLKTAQKRTKTDSLIVQKYFMILRARAVNSSISLEE